MDLSKEFDCVGHNILLSKLKRYGIQETALQWINSYLFDREQAFCLLEPDSLTFTLPKHIGAPQGSIPGPLLFLININDIINPSNILLFFLFADDTTVYVQHDSIYSEKQILNSEFAKIAKWFNFNKLTLIVNKTRMLMMSRKKPWTPKLMSSYVMKQHKE